MSNKYKFTISGGIGDILLSLSGVRKLKKMFGKENLECIIFSHFKGADDFLSFEEIDVLDFMYYSNNSERINNLSKLNLSKYIQETEFLGDAISYSDSIYLDLWEEREDLKNAYHMQIEKIIEKISLKVDSNSIDIIGIHPFGSKFSNDFISNSLKERNKNINTKELISIIKEINGIQRNCIFVIFGARKEEDMLSIKTIQNECSGIKILPFFNHDIFTSFAMVDYCNFIVASDSAIKSYSGLTKVPTVVFVGDYPDETRDMKFITPYEKDLIFKTIKFKDKIAHTEIERLRNIFMFEKDGYKWKDIQ